MTEKEKIFLLLQVNDALFPIGAYSHSYGLETYIQKKMVNNAKEAWGYLQKKLSIGVCCNELLSAKLAYGYGRQKDIDGIMRLEELLDACRLPRETREAGHKLGARFVKTLQSLDIPYELDVFNDYCSRMKKKEISHAVAYGVFCVAAGISLQETLEYFLYAQTSSMVTGCVKTIPLSQTDGQQLLYRCHGLFVEILKKLENMGEEDLCLSAPGFDIRCMQHEGLYSRIYMS